ncbi:MAG: L-arabinonate dehydratase [Bradyrhizobium sp.]|nr:L-arabinonate dehydratase [Bradyrhizobium sp.]
MNKQKQPDQLRSARWFAPDDLRSFGHRSRVMQMGYAQEEWKGRPVIAIVNTWSDAQPCHMHFKQRVDDVKRGVLMAGGFPIEFPALSLSESLLKPTTMLYRNMLAMDVEELLRSHPVDGVVLMGGCDKTTPALLLGATSMNLPAIYLPAGPMLRGNWKGKTLGSGSDAWKYWDERRAGTLSDADWSAMEAGIARSHGTCMTMGTASTMTAIAEAIGMTLPGASSIPAADAEHIRMSSECGRRIVEMVWEDLTPAKIQSRQAFENAIRTLAAIGGSTNAVVHLLAIAGRVGVELTLDDFDRLCRDVHCLVDLMPSGRFLMEDFYYAGGLPAVLRALGERGLLHKDARTVNGKTLWDNVADAPNYNAEVITPFETPFKSEAGIAILTGNLAPNGAVIKPSAASPELMNHTGRAVVFESVEEMHDAVDDDTLDIDASCIMVLKNCGPKGYPGMAEVGNMPLPAKLLREGVRDMIRISDARMSGTAYGTVVLHVAPEATVGGPLALVKNGDMITLDVAARRLHLHVSDEELATRRAAWTPPKPHASRGYQKLYIDHVLQADRGVDFDFLVGRTGSPVPRDNH